VDLSEQNQVFLTNVSICSPGGGGLYYCIPTNLLSYRAKTHLMRRTDQKIIELCNTYQQDQVDYDDFDLLDDDISEPVQLRNLCEVIHECGPKLTTTYMSDLVEQVGVDITFLEMGMSLKYQLVPVSDEKKDAYTSIVGFSLEPSFSNAFTGFVDAVFEWGDDRHGASFAHLIEAMDKWDD